MQLLLFHLGENIVVILFIYFYFECYVNIFPVTCGII